MIVDELILKLKADLSDVEKRLKEVEGKASAAGKNAGAEMGKTMGTSFGDVFSAIAGAAVLNTVKNFYSRAAAEFNKFEAAFLRVDSIAKGFGRSVDVARKNVDELAQKGFLNLNQAASSYADAIALGFDEKQARKFIDALSDVSAFQNTIGDGAAAVQSGLSGLLSNSAEKVENIGVPIKVLNMAYNENIKTMGKAAALQKFYAGVLKESEKFSGDAARAVDTLAGAQNKANAATDKAMVAIGKGLEPVLKSLYHWIESGFKWFTSWFEHLTTGTKTILLMIPVVSALTIALGALIPVLKAISLSNPFGWIALVLTSLGALVALISQLYGQRSINDLSDKFKRAREEAEKLGETAQRLSEINKRTAQEELTLIDTKEALRKKAKELGLDYDKLAASAKSYLDISKQLAEKEKLNAKADISGRLVNSIRQAGNIESGISSREKIIRQLEASGNTAEAASQKKYLLQDKRDLEREQANARAINEQLDKFGEDGGTGLPPKPTASEAGGKFIEQRFLESSNKILEIEKNRELTLRRYLKPLKDADAEEERQRRIKATKEDADLQVEAEFTARRQAYAEYIEDKYMADTEALKRQTDDAIRASNELLEAELKKAKDDEWAIQALKEDNEERLQKIRETDARKQSQITMQSFADTANAANATASGLSAFTRSQGAAGGLSSVGGIASGIAGFSDKFKSLGIFGQGISAVGSVVSTLQGLFGKSDEQREREAQQAQKQREEQLKVLDLQASYQKNMLALQEAAAKLPFENLQRNLRLIDINAQSQELQGGDKATIDANRAEQKRAALQGTLSSQTGAISGDQLFGGTGSSPEALIQFLSERAAQSTAISQFVGLANQFFAATNDINNAGTAASLYGAMMSYKGLIPDAFINAVEQPGAQAVSEMQRYANDQARRRNGEVFNSSYSYDTRGLIGQVNSLGSEVTADTSIAENLLSVIEQSNQIQLDIAGNTRKTADNTAKAVELRPDRERSFIDVGQGFIQSLGQRITSPSAIGIARSVSQNLTIPTELGAANVITGRARTLQERMADALETQIRQGATANDILRDIRAAAVELLAVMDGNPATVSGFDNAAADAWLADRERRRF